MNPYIVLGSAIVGLLVGLTGAGGGALMTPMLILLFNVKPSAAISSDLVAAVVMRPVGSVVHMRKGTVNMRLVGWMCLGSVPMAFLGAYLLHVLGGTSAQQQNVEYALGAALLVGTAAMLLRYWLDHRSGLRRDAGVAQLSVRVVPTVLIGAVGGLVVGMTSVGSGSLMIVLLLFTYPMISAGQLVGTDLTQAVPLTAAAALGALAFGHVQFGLTAAVIVGSVPAVLVGSMLSSRAPDKFIRPIITFVIFASGLKYAGLGTSAIGWVLCGVLVGCGGFWLVRTSRSGGRTAGAAAANGNHAAGMSAVPRVNGVARVNGGAGLADGNGSHAAGTGSAAGAGGNGNAAAGGGGNGSAAAGGGGNGSAAAGGGGDGSAAAGGGGGGRGGAVPEQGVSADMLDR